MEMSTWRPKEIPILYSIFHGKEQRRVTDRIHRLVPLWPVTECFLLGQRECTRQGGTGKLFERANHWWKTWTMSIQFVDGVRMPVEILFVPTLVF